MPEVKCFVEVKKTHRRRRTRVFLKSLGSRQVALFSGKIQSRKKYQTQQKAGWGKGWKQGNLTLIYWTAEMPPNPVFPCQNWPPELWQPNVHSSDSSSSEKQSSQEKRPRNTDIWRRQTKQPCLHTNFTVNPSRWQVLQHAGMPNHFPASTVSMKGEPRIYHPFEKNVYIKETKTNKQKNENISHPWNKQDAIKKEYSEKIKRVLVN